MLTGITHMHSAFRWLILILLVLTIVKHYGGSKSGKAYSDSDKKLALFTLIFAHLQMLFGFFLYIANGRHHFTGETMKNAVSRFWSVEHIAGMLIAIALITIGYSKAKKIANDSARYKKIFVFYFIALLLILASIPWPFRSGFENIGWF